VVARETGVVFLGRKLPRRQVHWLQLLAASCLVFLLDATVVETGWLEATDRAMWTDFANSLGQGGFRVVEGFSLVGVVKHADRYLTGIAIAGMLGAMIVLMLRGFAFTAAVLLVSNTACAATVEIMKRVLDRQGPPLTAWTPVGHTFPSGTAALAVVFFGFLAATGVQTAGARHHRWTIALSIVAGTAFIVSSLTYHFPTEVIGGVAIGLAWLSFMEALFWWPLRRELRQEPTYVGEDWYRWHGMDVD